LLLLRVSVNDAVDHSFKRTWFSVKYVYVFAIFRFVEIDRIIIDSGRLVNQSTLATSASFLTVGVARS